MEKLYKIGPVIVALRDLTVWSKYPFRDWKLDPFAVSEGKPDLWVTPGTSAVNPEGEPILKERSLYATRELYALPDGSILWQQLESGAVKLQYVLSADKKELLLTVDQTETFGMAALEAMTFVISYVFLQQDILSLHSVLIEHEGRGILVAAPSGQGKTTHARLWRDHKNALILNGDKGCCYRQGENWMGFGSPWCGTSGEYLNRQVPIQALVLLQQGPENRVEKPDQLALLQQVMPLMQYPFWDGEATTQMLQLLDDFLDRVPVALLECRPDTDAVDTLYSWLENLQ